MNAKKPLSIGIVALLLLSVAMVVVPVTAPAADAIYVDPPYTDGGAVGVGNTFDIEVKVNISNFAGFEYKIKLNSTLLTNVSHTYNPAAIWPGGSFVAMDKWTLYPNGTNMHWLSISSLPAVGVTGVFTLCTYTLRVVYQPFLPEPDGYSLLDLQGDKLSDPAAKPIVHTTHDGEYFIARTTPPPPKLEVIDPTDGDDTVWKPDLGTYFDVDIVIKNLATAWDLFGWEAKLSFNSTLINATAAVEGSFLPGFAGPNGTYFVAIINNTLGYVHMAGFFLGNRSAVPFGTGVLATVTFKVIYQTVFPPELQTGCPLDLYDTKLADSNSKPIGHDVNDGWYEAPHKVLGRDIDSFTGHIRKKYEWTPHIGTGPNEPADAYEPQDNVTLYALVQYNEEPEVNKTVTFEIYGPRNPYYNITIFRTAQTNASGIAMIWFTIPWPDEHPQAIVFGEWYEYESVQIKTEKVSDELWFKVGWLVELLNATVDPTSTKKDLDVKVTVNLKNIMMIQKWVVITVTILDELDDPIAWGIVSQWIDTTGEYCVPFYTHVNVTLHIPTWAHVGIATVFVNAFTKLPTLSGCVYSPEISVDFTILKTADP